MPVRRQVASARADVCTHRRQVLGYAAPVTMFHERPAGRLRDGDLNGGVSEHLLRGRRVAYLIKLGPMVGVLSARRAASAELVRPFVLTHTLGKSGLLRSAQEDQ